VCTQRGPLYADLIFLAEGDASHLVTREGYERFSDQRETPKFLQGIKQVIDMPEGAIESIFGLGSDEGAAYEILVRNGSLRGRDRFSLSEFHRAGHGYGSAPGPGRPQYSRSGRRFLS